MHQVPAEHLELFERFIAGPAQLRQAVDGLAAGGISQRAPGEDWSVRDVVTHLADAELVRAVRIRFILAEETPLLPPWDEQQWQRRLQYLWRDVDGSLRLFEATRWATAELVAHAGKAAWGRAGRSGETLLTAHDLVLRGAGHVDEHVRQIAASRAALKA